MAYLELTSIGLDLSLQHLLLLSLGLEVANTVLYN